MAEKKSFVAYKFAIRTFLLRWGRLVGIATFAGWAFLHLTWGPEGLVAARNLMTVAENLARDNRRTLEKINTLRHKINCCSDNFFQEKMAREQYLMAQPHELLYVVRTIS